MTDYNDSESIPPCTKQRVIAALKMHSIEIWNDYAVEQYYIFGIYGESFIHIDTFKTWKQVRDWLGY